MELTRRETLTAAAAMLANSALHATPAHGPNALGVIGSPRITNEANYLLRKFATELVGTDNYTSSDIHSLQPFFDNLGASLATHRDIRYAKTILLLGGEPEELQPLTGKQIRQAVRNGGARLIVINSTRIRLVEQAAQFIHIRRGTEDAAVLLLANNSNDPLAIEKLGIEANDVQELRQTLSASQGDLVIMFTAALSPAAQGVVGGGVDQRRHN